MADTGFESKRRKENYILVKERKNGRRAVVLPDHRKVDRGTFVEILRQAGLRKSEFLNLL